MPAATPLEPPPPPDDVTVIDQQGGLIIFFRTVGADQRAAQPRVLTGVYYDVLDDGSLDIYYGRTVVQPVG